MDDGFSSVDIKAIIARLRTTATDMSPAVRKRHCYELYETFAVKFPHLFEAALNPGFDLKFLDMILHERERLISRQTDVESADTKVYKALQSEYMPNFVSEHRGE